MNDAKVTIKYWPWKGCQSYKYANYAEYVSAYASRNPGFSTCEQMSREKEIVLFENGRNSPYV